MADSLLTHPPLVALLVLVACRDKSDGFASKDTSSTPSDSADTNFVDTNDSEFDTESGEDTDDSGEPSNPCVEGAILVDDDPTPHTSIQGALYYAKDGSVVHVCPGVHYETIQLWSGNPIFYDEDATISIVGNSAEDTIIDANGEGPVFYMGNATVFLSELTLRGGSGVEGEKKGDTFTVGGAIYNFYADIYMDYVVVESNEANWAGAMQIAGVTTTIVTMVLNNCAVRNNVAKGVYNDGGPYGGAIYMQSPFRLESYNTDWGEGKDDNEPEDIVYRNTSGGPGTDTYPKTLNFGANASFICDSTNVEEPCEILKK